MRTAQIGPDLRLKNTFLSEEYSWHWKKKWFPSSICSSSSRCSISRSGGGGGGGDGGGSSSSNSIVLLEVVPVKVNYNYLHYVEPHV